MNLVHFIVPAGIDDPARPSGGNAYDRRVADGLATAGWTVQVHEVHGSWPRSDARSLSTLAALVRGIPDGSLVLLDGLVASPAAAVLASEAERLRVVVLVHMPLGHGTRNRVVRQREETVLSSAASVVTTSAWARLTLLGLYPLHSDRVHVAEPGVDPAPLAHGTATAGALLSVAAVIRGKGHDLLLDALAPLTNFQWKCHCVGSLERDPAFVARLRHRVLEDRIDGRVCFSGPLAGADLARSYAAADVLILPSRAETYGMVIAEALARGLPVLAAEVGGVPEALGHAADGTRPGLLVPPGDSAALSDAIQSWLADADLRRRLRVAARERRMSLAGWTTTTSAVADALQAAAR
ncbi:MAG TPA: glycosyltransferase family 4 protein [Gaiellaceae bacterium]|nr:glycosyltransferase family 4 protein [Gaiellaceae bacterium]